MDKYGQIMNNQIPYIIFEQTHLGAHVKICSNFLFLYKFFLRINKKFLFMDKYEKIVDNQTISIL